MYWLLMPTDLQIAFDPQNQACTHEVREVLEYVIAAMAREHNRDMLFVTECALGCLIGCYADLGIGRELMHQVLDRCLDLHEQLMKPSAQA